MCYHSCINEHLTFDQSKPVVSSSCLKTPDMNTPSVWMENKKINRIILCQLFAKIILFYVHYIN